MKLRIVAVLLLLLCFSLATFSSLAIGSVVIESVEVTCLPNARWTVFFNSIYSLPLTNDDGEGGDYVAVYFFIDHKSQGAGVAAWTADSTYPWAGKDGFLGTSGHVLSIIIVDETTWDIGGTYSYEEVMERAVLDEMTVSYEDYCDGEQSQSPDVVMPPDERINWQYGDLNAVLYHGEDSEGNPSLTVYCYDGENASLGLHITSADTENAPIEAEVCDVTFYQLENGQVQVNIRDAEGKLYEIICEDLACETPILRYFDPNE